MEVPSTEPASSDSRFFVTPQDHHPDCRDNPQRNRAWFGNGGDGGKGEAIGKREPVASVSKHCPIACGVEAQNHIASEKSPSDEKVVARIEGETRSNHASGENGYVADRVDTQDVRGAKIGNEQVIVGVDG